MRLNKLLFPVRLEKLTAFDIGIETPVTLIERKKMHKHLRDSATRVLKNRITTQKEDRSRKKTQKSILLCSTLMIISKHLMQ